jgi:hypothetical protein
LVVSIQHLRRLLQSLFWISALAGLVAIVQFVTQYRDVRAHHPDQVYRYLTSLRIHGFMGHWMNFGGQQMLIFAFLWGFLLLSSLKNPQDRTADPASPDLNRSSKFEIRNSQSPSGPAVSKESSRISSFEFRVSILWWCVLGVVVASIILNFTRGVWLGCFVAALYMMARWKPRWLWALPILLVLSYVAAPSLVRERLKYALHPAQEPALAIRLEMWRVALRMIRAHPWVGVGPNNIEEVYDLYLPHGTTPVEGYHAHFHNDFLQFGAERGLPCLASWVWLMAALGWHTWKARRSLSADRWMADAAFGAWLAFLVEGCFEFNFGTSPVLMMFLFVTAAPFVAVRQDAP